MKDENKFYAENIKQLILQKKRMFITQGDSTVVFEKAVMRGKTICDCMIFTEERGVIGIEIKTERDSTKRLNSQLNNYEQVCDYVYVMCHDNHVPKVEQLLNRYKRKHVGILAYTEFRGEPLLGVYREALRSPRKSAYHMLDILWKEEILKLLGTFRHYGHRVETATGYTYVHTANRGIGVNGLYTKTVNGRSMPKAQLIWNLITKLGGGDKVRGAEEATRVFCDIFINNRQHPEKSIKLHHFLEPTRRVEQDE